jgi:hypothetical protein
MPGDRRAVQNRILGISKCLCSPLRARAHVDLTLVSMIRPCRTVICKHLNDGLPSRINRGAFPPLDLPDGLASQSPVHPLPNKYIASPFAKISTMHPAVPPQAEGRIAIVTNVECGMRWTRRRAGRSAHLADGEVVWS